MIGKNDVFDVVVDIGTHSTTTYLGDTLGNYPRTAWLEAGYLWEVVDARMMGSTTHTAASDFYKFYVKDASGNTICTIGKTFGINPATGIDSSPVTAYKTISTASAGTYLQVIPVQSGNGCAMYGLRCLIRIKRTRPGT